MKHQLSATGNLCIYLYSTCLYTFELIVSCIFFEIFPHFSIILSLQFICIAQLFENTFLLLHVSERCFCKFFEVFPFLFPLPFLLPHPNSVDHSVFLLVVSFCFCKLVKKYAWHGAKAGRVHVSLKHKTVHFVMVGMYLL